MSKEEAISCIFTPNEMVELLRTKGEEQVKRYRYEGEHEAALEKGKEYDLTIAWNKDRVRGCYISVHLDDKQRLYKSYPKKTDFLAEWKEVA